ncbi:MAG: SulP family inorganic anion transporter [Ruegeria sp.]|nr:SulP family inorganic anion transporter [Ruegeria sp.]
MLKKLATDRSNVLPDMMAGATVALIKTPRSMANAVPAWANPVAGLYGLMIALPLGAIFSSSAYMGVAPTSALAISAGEALYYTPETEKVSSLALLVFMVGIAQITFGLADFGRLTRYISNSVMKGFISGIAVLIVIASLRDITGFQSQQENQLLRLADTALNWRTFDQVACCIGICTIFVCLLSEKTRLFKFSPVFAVATTSKDAILIPRPVPGKPAALVLVLRDTDEVGGTIVRSLTQYSRNLDAAGNRLALAGVNESLFNQLNRTSLIKQLQARNVFRDQGHSGSSVNDAVVQSRAWIESLSKS